MVHEMVHERFSDWVSSKGSQEAVAELIGCSQAMVSAISRGTKRPGVELVHAIERATGGWSGGVIRTEEWLADTDAKVA